MKRKPPPTAVSDPAATDSLNITSRRGERKEGKGGGGLRGNEGVIYFSSLFPLQADKM